MAVYSEINISFWWSPFFFIAIVLINVIENIFLVSTTNKVQIFLVRRQCMAPSWLWSFVTFIDFTYSSCKFLEYDKMKSRKIASCQSWRSEKISAARPTSNQTRAAQVQFPDDRIILQLWQLVTLQPVNLQRLTVPLLKDLNLLC